MRKLLMFFVAFTLVACSSKPSQGDVETAIAQTQEAKPTEINILQPTKTQFILEEPKVTDKPSNTPKPTNTPLPTNAPVPTTTSSPSPTLAPTPSVPLRAVLVTINDFMTLSDFYHENPVLKDKNLESDIIIDSCEETFFGTDEVYGNVTMSLTRYINDATAKKINDGLKFSITLFDTSFQENERIPDNFWAGKTLANGVYASATYHDVLIWLIVEDFSPSVAPEQFAKFALLLINNQVVRLEDGGY